MRDKAYFISDLHLGASYIADHRAHERRVVEFLDSISNDAAELYLLGDILDYWYEYRTVVPRGHVRFFGALARLADSGVRIYWMTGNHDVWLFDYLRDEIGLTVLKKHTTARIMGCSFFLSHGDDVGYQKPMYRFMRACFYSRACQVLYASIHPRWTFPLAAGWSADNRTSRKAEHVAKSVSRSMQNLIDFSRSVNEAAPGSISHFVYGHLHIARQQQLPDGSDVTVLGNWIEMGSYAVFDGRKFELKQYKPHSFQ